MGDRTDKLSYDGKTWISEESIDKWMKNFQSVNLHGTSIDAEFIRKLAADLHDWIPLGYEASMRLATWMIEASKNMERYEKLEVDCDPENTLSKIWTNGKTSLYIEENPI